MTGGKTGSVMAASGLNVTLDQTTQTMATNTTVRPYDSRGAMMFTVATILLYAMSIIAFIAGNLRRRHTSKEEESQILKYLKQTEDIQRRSVKDDVLRLRSQLLADSVVSDQASHQRRKSRVERARHVLTEINCVLPLIEDEGRRSCSSTGSVELPACTMAAPTFDDDEGNQSDEESDSISFNVRPEVSLAYVNEAASEIGGRVESEKFLQLSKSRLPRYSLKESLQYSLLNGDLPNVEEDEEEEEEEEEEDSEEVKRYRQYRDRRRGVRLPT